MFTTEYYNLLFTVINYSAIIFEDYCALNHYYAKKCECYGMSANIFDATNTINTYRIFMILVLLKSAFEPLSKDTKTMKIHMDIMDGTKSIPAHSVAFAFVSMIIP